MNSIPEGDKFDSGKIFKTTADKFQSSMNVDPNVFRAAEFVFHGIIPFNVIHSGIVKDKYLCDLISTANTNTKEVSCYGHTKPDLFIIGDIKPVYEKVKIDEYYVSTYHKERVEWVKACTLICGKIHNQCTDRLQGELELNVEYTLALMFKEPRSLWLALVAKLCLDGGSIGDKDAVLLQLGRFMREVGNILQGPDEDVSDYTKRIDDTITKINSIGIDINSTEMQQSFIGYAITGMNDNYINDIKDATNHNIIKNLKTYADARRLMGQWVNRHESISSSMAFNKKKVAAITHINERDAQKNKTYDAIKDGNTHGTTVNSLLCFVCGQKSHWADRCNETTLIWDQDAKELFKQYRQKVRDMNKKTTKANVKQLLLKEAVADGKVIKKTGAKEQKKPVYFDLDDYEDQMKVDSD